MFLTFPCVSAFASRLLAALADSESEGTSRANEGPFKTEIQIVVVEDKLLDDEASHTHPRSSENTYVTEELGGEGRRIDKRDLT